MSELVDLSKIPQPDFIESLNFEAIFNARKAAFLNLIEDEAQKAVWQTRLALESEPVVMLLQENAYRELLLRQRINNGALSVSLAHAAGADLDAVAANYNVARLVVQQADNSVEPPIAEILESDEALRYRVQLAFDSISTAGAKSGYRYHALSCDGRVADVDVFSPQPCCVTVSVLSVANDGQADSSLIEKVKQALNDDNVRPVADRVTVQSAQIHRYQVSAKLYCRRGPEQQPIKQLAEKRLLDFVGRKARLGIDINISALHAVLHVEGVQRVEVLAPSENIVLAHDQAGYCEAVHLEVVVDE